MRASAPTPLAVEYRGRVVRRTYAELMSPEDRERWRILGAIHNHLAALDESTVNQWWQAPRPELDGRTADVALTNGFSVDSDEIATLVALARAAGREHHPAPRDIIAG